MQFQNILTVVKQKLQSPQFRQTYVNWSLIALNYAMVPINRFMKHLILVQGLDPSAEPGVKARQVFSQSLDKIFRYSGKGHADPQYDYKWAKEKFEKVHQDLRWGDLTQETFMELTDVYNFQSPPIVEPPAISTIPVETVSVAPLAINLNPLEELAELLNKGSVDQVVPVPLAKKDNEREQRVKDFIKKEREKLAQEYMSNPDKTNERKLLLDKLEAFNKLSPTKSIKYDRQMVATIINSVDKERDDEELGSEEVQKLVDRALELKEVWNFSRKYCPEELPKVEKPARAKIGGKIRLEKNKTIKSSKKQVAKGAQERDVHGRFKGTFKRTKPSHRD